MEQLKRDRKKICLSPFTTVQRFSEIRSHGANRKGRHFSLLSKTQELSSCFKTLNNEVLTFCLHRGCPFSLKVQFVRHG